MTLLLETLPVGAPALPDFTGQPLARARKILRNLGLQLGAVCYQDRGDHPEENLVLSQCPRAGEKIPPDGRVDITLSRKSLMDHLPGIMQTEDHRAGGLLKRYLWIILHMWTDFQALLSQLPDYFNPYRTPQAFLPWLAAGVGVELEPHWPLEKQRALVAKAAELYKWRGTRRGLISMIRVLTGIEVDIEEHRCPFASFVLDSNNTLGIQTILQGALRLEHCFTVRLPDVPEKYPDTTLAKIQDIIRTEKPAHTQYFMAFRQAKIDYAELPQFVLNLSTLGEGCLSSVN